MSNLSVKVLESYLKETYKKTKDDQGLFMKLVEEIGEVAELLNKRSGRKAGDGEITEELANELADVIHYAIAIAAVNNIDIEKAIINKDRAAAIKYSHEINLEGFMKQQFSEGDYEQNK